MNRIKKVSDNPASNVIASMADLERIDFARLPVRRQHTGFVMCRPDHFRVDYVINHHMTGNVGMVDRGEAILQWMRLRDILRERYLIHEMSAERKYPDMVFAANGALTYVRNGKKRAVMVRMRPPERQGEFRHFAIFLSRLGYEIEYLLQDVYFEGEGDARLDSEREVLWGGWGEEGFRSSIESYPHVSAWINMPVIPLRLVDRRFYHLDTCFLPFKDKDDRRGVMFYPGAFDPHSRSIIRHAFPDHHDRIELSEEEALDFPCNAPTLGRELVMPEGAPTAFGALKERGFDIVQTPMSEFLKGGGAAKCLVLEDYE